MSISRCFVDGCMSKLFGKCECEGIVLFCKEHAVDHVVKPSSKGHQCLRLYFRPADEIRQPIIDKLKEFKNDIKKYRNAAIANANEIINNFKNELGKYINKINEVEMRCNKMIEILYSGEEVLDIFTQDDMENVLKLNATGTKECIADWNIDEYQLDYKDINAAIKNIYKIPFKIYWVIESNKLSFFRANSSSFTTINLGFFYSSSSNLRTRSRIC
ncbi:unnamed protein product [Blepharisma stoltei]|uniref:Uncharacterized protein n=1 Tax=Blepharisma stoltei TaxID=1481888 RepID=A0AAU9IPT6_9CILI|nr:unnamed protein product [Blepharisma stoltei]